MLKRNYHDKVSPAEFWLAETLNGMADLYTRQDQYTLAEPHYEQALQLCENVLGTHHIDSVKILEGYANFLKKSEQLEKAATIDARVKEIQAVS